MVIEESSGVVPRKDCLFVSWYGGKVRGFGGGVIGKDAFRGEEQQATASSSTRRMPQRACLKVTARGDGLGVIWRPVAGAGMNS